MNDLFLKALACQNTQSRPPIWVMRQAGRYLPEYRELRKKHSLHELFHTPELAAQVTLQPIERFHFDAAIVFSDILVILEPLGYTLYFPEGQSPYAKETHPPCSVQKSLDYVAKTIQMARSRLDVPLIGFCGGPYTVARYLLGPETMKIWLESNLDQLKALLKRITLATIEYLQIQADAGVDALQVFDSWAGLLPKELFEEVSLPYLQQLIDATSRPTILFMRGASSYVQELASLRPAGISFDGQKAMKELRRETPQEIAVQGNLEPADLLLSFDEVRQKVGDLLNSMQREPGFIVNLGHGILPNTPLENVQALIEQVHHFATGGMEQRMASGLPPDKNPNLVPLS
jgi:uroporphyrinogen decarboxylase